MSRVIMTIGFVVAAVAYVVGMWGLLTTPDAHAVPTPDRLVTFGVVTMMAATLALVMVFAHGSRVGDQE